MPNLGDFTKTQTKLFIHSTSIDCSNSVNHDSVQVLSYSKYNLLITCSWDWTDNFQRISFWRSFQPNVFIDYVMYLSLLLIKNKWQYETHQKKMCAIEFVHIQNIVQGAEAKLGIF